MQSILSGHQRRAKVRQLALLLAAILGGSVLVSSASAAVAPANTLLPSVSGMLVVGSTLTADPGTWTGDAPITYGFQWQKCDSTGASCADIAGANVQAYVLAPPGPPWRAPR